MNMETAYELSIPTSNPQPLRTFDGEIIYTGDNEPLNTPTGNADVKEIASNNKIIWERAIPIQKGGETPLSFRATRAKPLLEWSIAGKTYQAWTPSPEPQVGNNKLDNSKIEKSSTITNFTYTDSSVSFGSMTVGSTINSAEIKSEDTSYAFSFSGDTNKVTFALKCYNSSHTYLGDANKLFDEESRAVMTLLSNTAYIRLVITTTVQGNISLTNLMLNKGNTVMAFESFKYLPNTGACPVQGVGDKTENLFDKTKVRVGWYSSSTSQIILNSIDGSFVSVKIKPNTTYTFSKKYFNISSERNTVILTSVYPEDERTDYNTILSRSYSTETWSFTTGSNDNYANIMFARSATDEEIEKIVNTIMLNEGSTALPYEPFGYKITEVSRGKNLLRINGTHIRKGSSYYGITVEDVIDGKIFFSGVANADTNLLIMNEKEPVGIPGKSYFLQGSLGGSIDSYYMQTQNGFRDTGNGVKITAEADLRTIRLIIKKGSDMDGVMIAPMISAGNTMQEYEPYREPITSTIYLNSPLMADEVLDSTGKREVEFKKMVLTGDEQWLFETNNRYYLSGLVIGTDSYLTNDTYCSHLPYNSNVYQDAGTQVGIISSKTWIRIRMPQTEEFDTVSEFKAYLRAEYAKGTPVTVYYPLATPTSETVDVPQIPTFKGNNVIDINTEVQPKNMDAVYLGKDGEFILFTLDKSRLDGERVIK